MNRTVLSLLSVIVAIGIIAGAVALRAHRSAMPAQPVNLSPISAAQLAAADGKSGHKCYVAIDRVVYEIKNSAFWQNGEHTTSGGRARCGLDLSKVIDQAPHGRAILDTLPQVGKLSG